MALKDWIKEGEDSYKAYDSHGMPFRVWVNPPFIGRSGKRVYEVWSGWHVNAEPLSSHYSKAAAHAALMKIVRGR
jgi:hypothetical protein